VVGSADLRGDRTLLTDILSGEMKSVDAETVEDWKNY
jgi:hypothetical protein